LHNSISSPEVSKNDDGDDAVLKNSFFRVFKSCASFDLVTKYNCRIVYKQKRQPEIRLALIVMNLSLEIFA